MDLYDYAVEIEKVEGEYHRLLEEFFREAPRLFKETRKLYGLSQRALAEILEVDFTYISKIENGQLKPGMPTVRKFGEFVKKGRV
jgi:predicted transcriptional regulator